jgi:hypothetical protein
LDIFELERDDFVCMDETRKNLPAVSRLAPYEVLWEGTDAQEAFRQYLAYREIGDREGYTPVFLADDWDCLLRESIFFAHEEKSFSPQKRQTAIEAAERYKIEHFYSHSFARLSLAWRRIRKEHKCRLYQSNRLTSGFGPCSFVLVKVATDHAWELPAYLPFCRNYGAPSLEQLIAILEAWKKNYGAQLLCIHFDMIQMIFDREGMDDEKYHNFAREIFCVQPDLVADYYLNFDNLVYNLKHGEQPVFLFYWV